MEKGKLVKSIREIVGGLADRFKTLEVEKVNRTARFEPKNPYLFISRKEWGVSQCEFYAENLSVGDFVFADGDRSASLDDLLDVRSLSVEEVLCDSCDSLGVSRYKSEEGLMITIEGDSFSKRMSYWTEGDQLIIPTLDWYKPKPGDRIFHIGNRGSKLNEEPTIYNVFGSEGDLRVALDSEKDGDLNRFRDAESLKSYQELDRWAVLPRYENTKAFQEKKSEKRAWNVNQIRAYAEAFEDGDAIRVEGVGWSPVDECSGFGSCTSYTVGNIYKIKEEGRGVVSGFSVPGSSYLISTFEDYHLKVGDKIVILNSLLKGRDSGHDFGVAYTVESEEAPGAFRVSSENGSRSMIFKTTAKGFGIIPRWENVKGGGVTVE